MSGGNLNTDYTSHPKTELIYFLLVDRFHSGNDLFISDALATKHSAEQLSNRLGGTLNGVLRNLHYLNDLGCTSIWLSPIMENDDAAYHGYAIRNFKAVDPRLGTLEELKELVRKAHQYGISVYLDIVLNHTADLWSYQEEDPEYRREGYAFKEWRDASFPIPTELRNEEYYEKKGRIVQWDHYPETREGDIFELKKLKTDASESGKKVRDILFDIYRWWIDETNVDGFRVDTIKHLSPATVNWFCHTIRSYTKSKGKSFLLFGEAIGAYSLFRHYCKLRLNEGELSKGLDRVLDFPLHFLLPDVVAGKRTIEELVVLLKERQRFIALMNAQEDILIGFLDNHDQVAQQEKARIHAQLNGDQVQLAYSLLHFICPVVQLYYGTEQGLQGKGMSDVMVREPMFDNRSMLHGVRDRFYKFKSIHEWKARNEHFFEGYMSVSMDNRVLRLSRSIWKEELVLLYNFGDSAIKLDVDIEQQELIWSSAGFPGLETNELPPRELLILRSKIAYN